MNCDPANPNQSGPIGQCKVDEHKLHRRLFLKGLSGGAAATVTSFSGLFENAAFAAETKKAQKHCILLWLRRPTAPAHAPHRASQPNCPP